MFKILNKNIILQWFLLAVGLLFLGYQITNIQIPKEPIGFPIFFNFIYQIAQKSLIAYKIIVSFIILLTLLFIQIYYSNNKFSQKPSIIPSIVYVSVLLLTRSLTTVTPILFTNFFIIIILVINDYYFRFNSKSNIFYSGILIGIAILFDPSAIFLILFLIIAMIINTVINPKDLYIALMGLLTVFIFIVAFFFFFDQLNILFTNFKQLQLFSIFKNPIKLSLLQWIFIPLNIFIFLFIVFRINKFYDNKVIVLRKKIITFNALIFISFITFLISNCTILQLIGYYFIPFAIVISLFSQLKSKFFLNEFFVALFLIGLCL